MHRDVPPPAHKGETSILTLNRSGEVIVFVNTRPGAWLPYVATPAVGGEKRFLDNLVTTIISYCKQTENKLDMAKQKEKQRLKLCSVFRPDA